MTGAAAPPDLLYIMGTGRSGTTILEILLSAGAGVFGGGEITHIFQDTFAGEAVCACGAPATECEIWSQVWRACGWSAAQMPALAALNRDFAWHSRFPAIAARLVSRRRRAAFIDVNTRLLGAAAAASGATTVVDSSKYAARALTLARHYPGRTRIVCLTRSAAGLMAAFAKTSAGEQKSKSPLGTLLYYGYALLCFRVVAMLSREKILFVRYEDLRGDPDGTLRTIAAWAGLDLQNATERLAAHGEFSPGHIVTGNRLRRQETIRFRTDERPYPPAPPGSGWAVGLMEIWRRLLRL